jgi:hypothetical protein
MNSLKQHGSAALLVLLVAISGHAQQPKGDAPSGFDVKGLRVSGCIDTNFSSVPCEPKNRRPAPPQEIKIGKVVYAIEVVDTVPPAGAVSGLSGKTCDKTALERGWCDTQFRIYLEAGRALKQEQTTLLHEIQHGILGTELSERETTYHKFIYKLAPKLLDVLQENPKLYQYLTSSDPEQN